MKNITINTDAGFYPYDKVGSFSYWIVSDGLLLKGSGLFKDGCKNSTDAETKSMVNAVAILLQSNFDFSGVQNIYFNRDNIHAKSGKSGTVAQKKLTSLILKLKRKCHDTFYPKVHYRHVRSHTNVKDKRSYVNQWCDSECTSQLRNWKQQQLLNK